MNVGFLGGTFDPIHRGHLAMARAAARACGLQRIYFVPAAHPWHKQAPEASHEDRYAMLALALTGHPQWLPLAIPDSGEATYTVDQLAVFSRQHRGERVHLILGADAFITLPEWKQYRRLLRQCDFVVLGRRGVAFERLLATVPRGSVHSREGSCIQLAHGRRLWYLPRFRSNISSTAVRRALDPRHRGPVPVPVAVADYARRGRLYPQA